MTEFKPGSGMTADHVLAAEPVLRLVITTPIWAAFEAALRAERENAVLIALYDEKKSRKHYAGYVQALDWMLGLPGYVLSAGEQIRAQRDAESKVKANVAAEVFLETEVTGA